MSNQQIRINQVNLVNESLKHLFLILKDYHVRLALFCLLLCVKWDRNLIEFADKCKVLELFLHRRTILIYFALDDAGDHSYLGSVL